MDPFAALSFAGNVLQFIDTGLKILHQSSEILHSSTSAPPAIEELLVVARGLARIGHDIRSPSSQELDTSGENEGVNELKAVAKGCEDVATRLSSTLIKLRRSDTGSRWQAIRQSARIMHKKSDIQEMSDLLSQFRGQISLHVLSIIR